MDELSVIRGQAELLLKTRQFESATFYAELLIKNNEDCLSDALLFTEILYFNKQYRRALNFIVRRKLEKKYLTFRLLAAQCCVGIKDFIEALKLLNKNVNLHLVKANLGMSATHFCENKNQFWIFDHQEPELLGRSYKVLESNCYLVLGEIYEHMENRESATIFYKLAIKSDIMNYNSVRKLYDGNMLTITEAHTFLDNLDYSSCENDLLANTLRNTYVGMFDIYNHSSNNNDNKQLIMEHPYIQKLNQANLFYNSSRFKKCYEITKSLLEEEPYNEKCFILHSAVLKEIKLDNELFKFASRLVDNYPEKKESWYSLGCYYLATKRYIMARKQFLKATEIDKFFGYAWLAVGHTYSIENERDQALAAYCSASHAISESHIPILYIAVEYSLSKTMPVSLNYLEEAMSIGAFDPYCWHEKGFILFNNKNYHESLKCFLHAYAIHKKDHYNVLTFWEPLLNNIGHCYYKMGEYDNALKFFKKALSRKPKNPSTTSSIALVYAHKGDFLISKIHLQNVLGMNRDNLFANSLLQVVTNFNFKQPRKFLENNNTDDFFKKPQFNLTGCGKESFSEKCNVSNTRVSIQRIGNAENMNLESDDEMDFT